MVNSHSYVWRDVWQHRENIFCSTQGERTGKLIHVIQYNCWPSDFSSTKTNASGYFTTFLELKHGMKSDLVRAGGYADFHRAVVMFESRNLTLERTSHNLVLLTCLCGRPKGKYSYRTAELWGKPNVTYVEKWKHCSRLREFDLYHLWVICLGRFELTCGRVFLRAGERSTCDGPVLQHRSNI